jgi:hypothetical protein
MKPIHALAVVSLLSMTLLSGCDETTKAEPGAKAEAGAAEVAAEAGVIAGTAKTIDGRSLKSFGGGISGYSSKSGQTVSTSIDGADGKYRTDVGPGQFATRAWTDVEYNGRKYRIDLEPVDGKGGLVKQDTKDGVIKHFVWKLDGFRAGCDERSTDRFYSHCGASINFNPEGHGVTYWTTIKKDYQHTPEPPIPADAIVELTLTPDGPLIDGSEGKPVVLKIRGADIQGYMDRITRGIPIGKYHATARATLADGSVKPLRVTPYYSSNVKDAPEPAAKALIEFQQSSPPSENVNNVDELVVHVMF